MVRLKRLIKKPFEEIYTFFLWSSGAELEILKQAPTDKNKYFGIGGTIIFTALMASFAGGYAFFTAFKQEIYGVIPEATEIIHGVSVTVPEHEAIIGYSTLSIILAILFGGFWGSLIFNLDRYIVSTFGVGDGKKSISKQELIEAAPRLIMAILLGFIIATPLELKLFENEINARIKEEIAISKTKLEQQQSISSNDIIDNFKGEISSLNAAIEHREEILRNKRLEYNSADEEQRNEWLGLGKTHKKGKGELWEELNNKSKKLLKELEKMETDYAIQNYNDRDRISNLQKQVSNYELNKINDIEEQKKAQDLNKGLLASLKALDHLSYEEVPIYKTHEGEQKQVGVKKVKSIIWYSKWLISILFMFIEIAPILFKMMTERGPYDDIIDRIKHETKVNQLLLQSNLNEEVNTSVKAHSDKNAQKLKAEYEANEKMLESIAKAQGEIAQVAIEEWKNEQIRKVKADPSLMIKS